MLRIAATGALAIAVAVAMSGLLTVKEASAAALTSKSDTMTRLQDNTDSDHTIKFTTPTGVAAGQTMTVTFPAAFGTAEVIEDDVDVKDDAVELTTAADCTGSEEAGVVMAADVLTITICSEYTGGIGTNSVVEVQIGANATSSGTGNADHRITNPDIASDTAYEITIDATTDDGQLKVQILMDDSVNVTATVDESISFAISDVEIGFGDLSVSTGRWANGAATGDNASTPALPTAAHTMSIGTNATGGYAITYNGATLTSGGNTITDAATIDEDSDGTPGNEQFGISASTSDNATIASGYLRDTVADWDYVPSTTTTLVSETIATATETISVSYLANIAAPTEAGSYSTDITYVATATF